MATKPLKKEKKEPGMKKEHRRQWIAGALTTAFSYAGAFALLNDPVKTLITDAHWQQAPIHLVFALVTSCAGMSVMAAYDHFRGKRSGPVPTTPKVT